MITNANIAADLFLSVAALIGLVTLARSLQVEDGATQDPILRRFLFGLRVTRLLFGGRALEALTGGQGFRFLILIAAAMIPLAVLLLTEGLLRRHAPAWIKVAVAAATILFVFLAFWSADLVEPFRITGLLIFQVAGLSAAGWLVLTRDKAGLSPMENETVGRLGLSLIILIPLIMADYLMEFMGLPVQISGLGVLVLCWLAIGLGRAQIGHGGAVAGFVILVAAAFGTGWTVAYLAAMDVEGTVITVVLIMAAIMVLAILSDARSLRIEAQSQSLLQHLATGRIDNAEVFLRDLRAHPRVEGAVMIGPENLTDFDATTLDRIFKAAPVLRKSEPPALGGQADDHIGHLFDRFAATHIFEVTDSPRLLVALAMPALGTASLAELELQTVQRMAALIAKRGAL